MKRVTVLAMILLAAGFSCNESGTQLGGGPSPTQPIDPLVARGAAAAEKRGCPTCHQSQDPADGLLSGVTVPRPQTMAYPANLTPDPDTGLDGWTDEQILRALREGLDDEGQTLCPSMPVFADLGGAEGKAIVAYLRSLPSVHHAIPESACPPLKPPPPADAGQE